MAITVDSSLLAGERLGLRGPIPSPVRERFWAKVEKGLPNECWNWTGGVNRNGYGRIRIGSSAKGPRVMCLAHRLSYVLSVGQIPDGLNVCHHCDNRRCCNPAHFFIGTNADNDHDRDAKGRTVTPTPRKGFDHPMAKFTPETIGRIKAMRADGKTQTQIASVFGVNHSTIGKILRGQTYADCQQG